MSVSGPAWKPCTDTLLPQLSPASTGTSAAETPVTPGCAGQLVLDSLEQRTRLLRLVAVQLRRDAERDDVVRIQPEIDPPDVEEAPCEERGHGEKKDGHHDLRARQDRAEPLRGPRPAGLSGEPLQRRDEVRARAVQRGEQAEQQPRADRDRRHEHQNAGVDRERDQSGIVGRHQRGDQPECPVGDEETRQAAECGEHDRFGQELTDEVSPTGADGEPDRHLRRAPRRTGEQEIGDVRARAEEHDPRDAEQDR